MLPTDNEQDVPTGELDRSQSPAEGALRPRMQGSVEQGRADRENHRGSGAKLPGTLPSHLTGSTCAHLRASQV